MSRKSHLVRASLAACAVSMVMVLSSSTSWAGVLNNLNLHVQPVLIYHPHVPVGIGAHNPKQFASSNNPGSYPGIPDNEHTSAGDIGKNNVFRDSQRWGQKGGGHPGGQPGWDR